MALLFTNYRRGHSYGLRLPNPKQTTNFIRHSQPNNYHSFHRDRRASLYVALLAHLQGNFENLPTHRRITIKIVTTTFSPLIVKYYGRKAIGFLSCFLLSPTKPAVSLTLGSRRFDEEPIFFYVNS